MSGKLRKTNIANAIMEGKSLIQDTFRLKVLSKKVVNEDVNGTSRPVLKFGGRFQFADKLNANRRVYPYDILKEAVEAMQHDIKNRGILGEYDHPQDAKIHLDRVSHVLTKLWMEGKEVFGECEVLADNPCGKQLKSLLESRVRIGISSRGVGDLESGILEGEEVQKVCPGFLLVTFDVVAEPSVHDSYISVKEDRERVVVPAPKKVIEVNTKNVPSKKLAEDIVKKQKSQLVNTKKLKEKALLEEINKIFLK